jgi:hypothetical protein
MLESLEGRRGVIRAKPPLPAIEGLFGKPTVVNNVLSLAAVPTILTRGAEAYRDLGVGARAAPRSSSWRATSSTAGSSRRRSASPSVSSSKTSAAARRAAGRCAPSRSGARWAPIADEPFRFPWTTRPSRRRCHGRPRGHRGLRRHRRHEPPGPFRDGVLRRGVLRQVHALPIGAVRGVEVSTASSRASNRGQEPRSCSRTCARR